MTKEGGYATPDYAARKRPLESDHDTTGAKRPFPGGNEPLLKLTVPVYMAGALIGKAGSVLNELKAKYGGNIRLSAGKEYYPGTEERVVVLTGTCEQILDMNRYIMEKMENPGRDSTMKQINIDERRSKKVKIVLTSLAAGLLIGKGGNTIKGIQNSTKAILSITGSNEGTVPGERVLTVIADDIEDRTAACRQIVDVISNEASNMHNTILRYPAGASLQPAAASFNNDLGVDREYLERAVMAKLGMPVSQHGNGADSGGGGGGGNGVATRLQAQVEVNVDIASALVGGILGKHGAIVKEISQRSGGAHLTFGDKPSDTNAPRNLRITGNMEQTYKAYNIVEDRVAELENQARQQQKLQTY